MTAGTVLRISPANNAVAIYTVADRLVDDLGPLLDPVTYRSRVKAHSAWQYMGIIAEVTGSLSLPGIPAPSIGSVTHSLFNHGVSGVPGVFGIATNLKGSGIDVPLMGTVGADSDTFYPRFLNLLVDSTTVYLSDWGMVSLATGFSGFTLNWTVYISEHTLS